MNNSQKTPVTIREILLQAEREILDGDLTKAHNYVGRAVAILERIGKEFAEFAGEPIKPKESK